LIDVHDGVSSGLLSNRFAPRLFAARRKDFQIYLN
jgi:hypothetical protein